ncbi:MAG TPA: hypothetical protein VGL11_04265 [Candidatus Binatia bacterium]|jgi:hypothetical protein
MATATAWTIVLRCYNCNGKFTVRHLALDRVSAVALVTPCPHCSARPSIVAGPQSKEKSKLHGIFDLKEEVEAAYRKIAGGDTWHFDHNCSQWPLADYVELEIPPSVGEYCNECKAKQSKAG